MKTLAIVLATSFDRDDYLRKSETPLFWGYPTITWAENESVTAEPNGPLAAKCFDSHPLFV